MFGNRNTVLVLGVILQSLFLVCTAEFSLTIPIYFDIPKHLSFLVPRTQYFLEAKLSKYEFEIDYKTECLLGKGPSYTVKLDYSKEESYFISPYGKTIIVYQTDILIAHNRIPEFIAQLIVEFVLKTELEHFDKNSINVADHIGIEMAPGYNVSIKARAPVDYVWDGELFQYLFQPVLNELQDLIYLNVMFNYEYVDQLQVLHLEDIESMLNFDQLTLLIYLSSNDQEISGIDSKNIIIPKKGAVQLARVTNVLDDMQQIEIMEVLTGQLFRLLGMEPTEPKSPFIRIDFMIRKQVYINYQKLNQQQQTEIDELLQKAKWGEALRLSWFYLKS